MTWETMQPREREAWLAEKIGWHIGGAGLVEAGLIPPQAWVDAHGEFKAWISGWHPLTDPAAALGLLVAVEAKGFHWRIQSPFDPKRGHTRYFVGLTAHSCTGWNGRPDFEVAAESFDTLPAAICHCVYRTLGEDDA